MRAFGHLFDAPGCFASSYSMLYWYHSEIPNENIGSQAVIGLWMAVVGLWMLDEASRVLQKSSGNLRVYASVILVLDGKNGKVQAGEDCLMLKVEKVAASSKVCVI